MSKIRLIGLLLTILTSSIALLYGQFLSNPIIFDDLPFFMVDFDGNQPVSLYHFNPLETRSLPYATLAWTKSWFGLELTYFRIGNALFHIGVVLSVFVFLFKLFTHVLPTKTSAVGLNPQLAAFFAALLFALHPVSSYAVGYLVQRTTVMATLFGVLALVAYTEGSLKQKPAWLWLTLPLYYLAIFSKEHAIMLPAVLMALTVLLDSDWRARLLERWSLWLAMVAIAGLVVLTKLGLLGSVYELNASEMLMTTDLAYPLSVLTQATLFFKYLLLWVFPNPTWMSIDMREAFAPSISSFYLLGAICYLAWGLVAFTLLRQRGARGLVGFAMLYPWFMFMTEFSTVRIQEVFVLYRSYLWVPGALCVLPVIFLKVNGRSAALILSIFTLAMVPVSMERLMTLSHPVLVWDDAEKLVKDRTDLPGIYRIYYNRGTELIKIDRPDEAIADLKRSVALSKDFIEAYGNLGTAYLNKSDWINAAASFTRAIDIAKGRSKQPSPRHLMGRAEAFEGMGEAAKALADYTLSCQMARRGCDRLR